MKRIKTAKMYASVLMAMLLICVFGLNGCGSGDEAEGGLQGWNHAGNSEESADSNYESSMGYVLHSGGYTYLISGGVVAGNYVNEDEGRAYDILDIDYSIWRIADDKNAEPEKIYQAPSIIGAMSVCGDKIYFLKETVVETEVALYQKEGVYYDSGVYRTEVGWVTLDGSKEGSFPVSGLGEYDVIRCSQENGKLYLTGEEGTLLVCDLEKEACEPFCPAFMADPGYEYSILTVKDENVYFVKWALEEDEPHNGVFRGQLGGSEAELLARLDPDTVEGLFYNEGVFSCVANGYFYYMESRFPYEGELRAVDLKSGDDIRIAGDEDDEISCPNITDEGIYYFMDHDLCFCKPDGSNARVLVSAEDQEEEWMLLAVCGDWIVYANEDKEFYRIQKNGKAFARGSFLEWD